MTVLDLSPTRTSMLMDQAHELVAIGYLVPACMVARGALEDHCRALCRRYGLRRPERTPCPVLLHKVLTFALIDLAEFNAAREVYDALSRIAHGWPEHTRRAPKFVAAVADFIATTAGRAA